MIYLYLLQTRVRTASAAWQLFSSRRLVVAALATALLLGAGLLTGATTARAQGVAAPPAAAININAADVEALAAGLKGVGPARAKEIVRYRESYGPFSSVEELTEVQGISKSTLDKNRTVITLE